MQMTKAEIEAWILALLRAAPMQQCEIADHLPSGLYVDVGHAVRALAAKGLIERERAGSTYNVRIKG